ncbi:UDP-3-O-(3-hydroxymyristoyl)glucosamine N-acyltransferase [Aquicella lusitana]|uniref:UDP-3-O-acylglucosamine N-acyltransferase n=1 Tax=Aquicella lusitana TaxID=254246 RepID=A0A370GDC5_9COXI|nr:UDP-3-O-(3-hydroxymyristoyl)glucosamine N-acyltransferase [Aquicella lusitana]RDI41798.1 UDP-3-O-[3-hydroxymyristoyl] glucosamine N-acyltransferase [Aquicella lusitana]VVC73707.1 UDP-3-O-acylglucosamine N-acyltransferase [Aquicella lusitana]
MQALNKTQYSLSELTKGLDVMIKGDPHCMISGICTLNHSRPGHIAFLTNSLYRKYLPDTQASAVILTEEDAAGCTVNAVISRNPYYTYSQIAAFFNDHETPAAGIHPTVVIGKDTYVDPSASIGAHCIIGKGVKIAANAVIGPGCIIGDFSVIGEATQLDARVTLYHRVKIGKRTRIASGVVIGSDGFGFANQKGVWHKVPQVGGVEIGDDVDIGANTTIDRGAVEDTVIENGVKLDNLIQVAHNVRIGAHTVIAGCTGIAGSTVIGKHCMIGGAAMIAGHLTITDGVMLTGGTGVTKSIQEPGIYSTGILGLMTNQEFRKKSARFHQLESLVQRVKSLESALKELTERNES